jgi:hypothetical protein
MIARLWKGWIRLESRELLCRIEPLARHYEVKVAPFG